MRPGQPVLDGTTKGGWYRSGDNLRQTLITLGLPDRPPLAVPAPAASATPAAGSAPAADPAPALWPRIALGVGLLTAAAAGGALLLRRRSHPGTAAAR
jgi:hypothetical protein